MWIDFISQIYVYTVPSNQKLKRYTVYFYPRENDLDLDDISYCKRGKLNPDFSIIHSKYHIHVQIKLNLIDQVFYLF